MTKVIEKNYQTLDFISLEARYRDGRTATLMVSLLERSYSLEIVGLNGKVENGNEFFPLRRRKVEELRCALEESGLLDWKSREFGTSHYHEAPLHYNYGYDEVSYGVEEAVFKKDIPPGCQARLHKLLEKTIGVTFRSYRYYDRK
ncbi:hypothetical protein LGW51_04590 [Streptococcus mutans]|uniref:hypothetical protein n=1 Tax=Streptococcus mutans TaxID=1309 RepID=UPI000465ECA4|nr:hypothetical protein [Streptococcus mutans]MCB4927085.1 hypothetical protein [Streptococcus mutans]MCB4938363.1 hypothetical protein [Streptococcus mutans]MCB4947579.1 hypothetical protein [Streptococcus mutans]MCB4963222.1 hypothetical protein [Streptococcus mutans]MCB5042083.1 hypothetical protein [Streptococcus mutans]